MIGHIVTRGAVGICAYVLFSKEGKVATDLIKFFKFSSRCNQPPQNRLYEQYAISLEASFEEFKTLYRKLGQLPASNASFDVQAQVFSEFRAASYRCSKAYTHCRALVPEAIRPPVLLSNTDIFASESSIRALISTLKDQHGDYLDKKEEYKKDIWVLNKKIVSLKQTQRTASLWAIASMVSTVVCMIFGTVSLASGSVMIGAFFLVFLFNRSSLQKLEALQKNHQEIRLGFEQLDDVHKRTFMSFLDECNKVKESYQIHQKIRMCNLLASTGDKSIAEEIQELDQESTQEASSLASYERDELTDETALVYERLILLYKAQVALTKKLRYV